MNLSHFTDVVHAAIMHDENTQISSQPTNPFRCHAEICVAAETRVHLAGARTAVTSALLQDRDIRNIVEYVYQRTYCHNMLSAVFNSSRKHLADCDDLFVSE